MWKRAACVTSGAVRGAMLLACGLRHAACGVRPATVIGCYAWYPSVCRPPCAAPTRCQAVSQRGSFGRGLGLSKSRSRTTRFELLDPLPHLRPSLRQSQLSYYV